MKKLIAVMLSILAMQSAFADDDLAKMRIKISGPISSNAYYLCVSSSGGCSSIYAGSKGQVFPMEPGKVSYIFTANIANAKMYPQTLPASCNVAVNKNQTLVVSGKVVVESTHKASETPNVRIDNLHCSLA